MNVVVSFLHDLFAVIWLGNLIITYFSIIPTAREVLGPGPEVKKFMSAYQNRQGKFGMVSMLGLIITGMVMAKSNPDFAHLFSTANTFSQILTVKHLMVIASFAIALYSSLVLGRGKPDPKKEKLSGQLLALNVILAFLILFFSSWLTTIATQ
ncbi:hypothetical protein [Oceanithermus sp.]